MTFDNNLLLGAAGWSPARRDVAGSRLRFARMGFRRVCFFDHLFLGEGLNRDISEWFRNWIREAQDSDLVQDVQRFLRCYPAFVPSEKLGVCTDTLELADSAEWPMIPFRVGLAVVIVTNDNRVVVPLRSRHVAIGDRHAPGQVERYSSSVGEGMAQEDTVRGLERLRKQGSRRRGGKNGQYVEIDEEMHESADAPSLVALAARALLDEMGLEDQVDCDVGREVSCISLNFDRHEAFPYLSTMLTIKQSFNELLELRRRKAKDGWENKDVLGLPWDKETAKCLANGRVDVASFGRIVAGSKREQIFFAQVADALGIG